jgi:hypothetical protein
MKNFLFVVIALVTIPATMPALADSGNCPPGLAKKSLPCVPPGQAKKGARLFTPGDRIDGYDLHWIRYPDRYTLQPLDPGQRYVIVGNQLLSVSEETLEVIALIRLVDAILD